MRRTALHYLKGLSFLLSYMCAHHPERLAELPAIITHWLQDMSSVPIYFDSELRNLWENALIKYSILESGNDILRDNFHGLTGTGVTISFDSVPFPPRRKTRFTFVDLFAGIGGFRIALQNLGGKCVFACDSDKKAKETYFRNFGVIPFGDVRQFTSGRISDQTLATLIPDHDILAAGFPCQPFSLAGVSARNHLGQPSGLRCEEQGNLFYDIVRIARVKQPKVLFLENVKNIISHDNGKTFSEIRRFVERELDYDFKYEVIDSSLLVPQHRERCYFVCFRHKDNRFTFPRLRGTPMQLGSILEDEVSNTYTISDTLWVGHRERTKRNIQRGTGFTVTLADLSKPSATLVSRYGKDGKECLIPQDGKNPRKLTPRECARLQGFPDNFLLPDSDTAAYKLFGNSVPVPVIEVVSRRIIKELLTQRSK